MCHLLVPYGMMRKYHWYHFLDVDVMVQDFYFFQCDAPNQKPRNDGLTSTKSFYLMPYKIQYFGKTC